jgi:hypothetical protein
VSHYLKLNICSVILLFANILHLACFFSSSDTVFGSLVDIFKLNTFIISSSWLMTVSGLSSDSQKFTDRLQEKILKFCALIVIPPTVRLRLD